MDKEKFSVKERMEFLKEAGKIDEEITNKEIAAAKLRMEAKKAENALGLSTKEDKEELANLEAKLIQLETSRLSKAKLVTSQISALTAQERAEKKTLADETKAIQKELDDFNTNTKEEKRQAEKDKLKTQFDELMVKAGEDNEAKLELQRSYDERLLALKTKHGDDDAAAQKVIDDAALAAQKKTTDEEIAKEQAVSDAKMALLGAVGNAMGAFSALAGKETAAGKALGIAQATISTYTGIASIWGNPSDIGPTPIQIATKVAGSLAVAASGFAAVKNIVKTKVPNVGGAGGGGGVPSMPSSPTFNVVGQSQGNVNSQTETAAQQTESENANPTRAYVVSTDITSQQALDRDIESQGELG
jgi:hypothetical protein